MRRALPMLLAVAVVVALVVGLMQASGDGGTEAGPKFDLDQALASLEGAPPALASLHDQAAELVDGGVPAFEDRLKELRGHPVVINKWGSWCGPCRTEFPVFQRVGAKYGDSVAFLGIDGHDNRGDAADFLREFPTTYPSYVDPDEKISQSVGAPANYPITVFIDERGKTAFVHQGQYRKDADLEADIEKYLSGSASGPGAGSP